MQIHVCDIGQEKKIEMHLFSGQESLESIAFPEKCTRELMFICLLDW